MRLLSVRLAQGVVSRDEMSIGEPWEFRDSGPFLEHVGATRLQISSCTSSGNIVALRRKAATPPDVYNKRTLVMNIFRLLGPSDAM